MVYNERVRNIFVESVAVMTRNVGADVGVKVESIAEMRSGI